jgi:hypothetical protein
MTFDDSQRRRMHALLDAMKEAFERYAVTTDLQEAAMHLRRQRIQEFDDAYEETLEILRAS